MHRQTLRHELFRHPPPLLSWATPIRRSPSALIDPNELHRDLLLASGPISLQRFHLHRKRPRKLVECPFRAILLEDVVHMGEAAVARQV